MIKFNILSSKHTQLQIESEDAPQVADLVPLLPGRLPFVQFQRGEITHVENMPGAVLVHIKLRVLHVCQRANRSKRAQAVLIELVFFVVVGFGI